MRLSSLHLCALGFVGLWGCAAPAPAVNFEPMSERTLAARKLQTPLTQRACRAAVYPRTDAGWPVATAVPIVGRGETFTAALEALCREADGQGAVAVADLFHRPATGFSPSHEVRGTALRFAPGFTPPPAPDREAIPPPPRPSPGDEPPPKAM